MSKIECLQCGKYDGVTNGICMCGWNHKEKNRLLRRPLILPDWHPLEEGYEYLSANWMHVDALEKDWGKVWSHSKNVQFAIFKRRLEPADAYEKVKYEEGKNPG